MEILNKMKNQKQIDWKDIAKDLRADLAGYAFAYRKRTYYR